MALADLSKDEQDRIDEYASLFVGWSAAQKYVDEIADQIADYLRSEKLTPLLARVGNREEIIKNRGNGTPAMTKSELVTMETARSSTRSVVKPPRRSNG